MDEQVEQIEQPVTEFQMRTRALDAAHDSAGSGLCAARLALQAYCQGKECRAQKLAARELLVLAYDRVIETAQASRDHLATLARLSYRPSHHPGSDVSPLEADPADGTEESMT